MWLNRPGPKVCKRHFDQFCIWEDIFCIPYNKGWQSPIINNIKLLQASDVINFFKIICNCFRFFHECVKKVEIAIPSWWADGGRALPFHLQVRGAWAPPPSSYSMNKILSGWHKKIRKQNDNKKFITLKVKFNIKWYNYYP